MPRQKKTKPNKNIKKSSPENPLKTKAGRPSALVAVIAGIVVIVIGITTYNYFGKRSEIGEIDEGTIAPVQVKLGEDYEGVLPGQDADFSNPPATASEKEEDSEGFLQKLKEKVFVSSDKTDEEELKIEVNTEESSEPAKGEQISGDSSNESKPTSDKTAKTSSPSTKVTHWTANDYKYGDITTSQYEVKSGDTLWEIAEGFYGKGSEWIKIAKANNVSYLPNGNPLILPGQNLTLP